MNPFATNLRTRLTVLYAALLTAALLVYAGCVSVFFLHNLREEVDSSLDRDVETVEGALHLNSTGGIELSSHAGEVEEHERDRGYFLEVWSRDGNLLYRSEELRGQSLGLVPRDVTRHDGEPARSLRLSSRMQVRTMTRIHHLPGGNSVFVRLGVSEESLWQEFWEMELVLGIGLPVVVILVVITGFGVAARALKPVDAMAKRAAEINAEHLNERLTISNPNDELGQLGTAFNATLARLESSFDQLRRFTADASHELRTPLTAIRSVGEVSLQRPGEPKDYRDTIGSMLEETNRLTRLVDSLLTMSRADAGKIHLQRTNFSLLDLAEESVSLLEVLAEEKQQALCVDGDEGVIVNADRTILRQALVNLIDNAVKYSHVKSRIRIRVTDTGRDAVVEVEDSGPGIPAEHLGRIFERFYRVDKSRSRADGGTGLGLSIAEWAVTVNGGKIEIQSEPDQGSIFRIRMPRLISGAAASSH
jgi:heavy metal sensor kinase